LRRSLERPCPPDRIAGARCVVTLLAIGTAACSGATGGAITPVYDSKSGKLTQLVYDANHDGRPDTWSDMDGSRIVRIQLDTNFDGRLDRWEYFDPAGKLERVGLSRDGDEFADTWLYSNADGSLARIEQTTERDGRITRREFYEHGVLARVEEDRDGDGQPDKWETYEGSTLKAVAYDTSHRGKPDRQFIYAQDGTLDRIEDGAGHRVDAGAPSPARIPDTSR
jgi:hypothetical protein